MTSLDDLWFLADEAERRAERVFYGLRDEYDDFLERETTRHVSRDRFRTLARRIRENGVPYGAHTLVYRPDGALLLCRDSVVDRWVLPGGALDGGESFREAARRELREEAGLAAGSGGPGSGPGVEYEGLGYLARVFVRSGEYDTWGVLPVFAARAPPEVDPEADDPDGEIVDVGWFQELPEDTRDRGDLRAWREWALG